MLIRAPVKSSFRVYFPDEIRRRRLSHLHYTQSICLGKRLCVILILFGNVVSSLQSLQLYHHGPLLQLVAFFIALHCTAFFNARRTHHWCLGYLILLTFSVLKITNILLYQKEILTMVLALHLVASPCKWKYPKTNESGASSNKPDKFTVEGKIRRKLRYNSNEEKRPQEVVLVLVMHGCRNQKSICGFCEGKGNRVYTWIPKVH